MTALISHLAADLLDDVSRIEEANPKLKQAFADLDDDQRGGHTDLSGLARANLMDMFLYVVKDADVINDRMADTWMRLKGAHGEDIDPVKAEEEIRSRARKLKDELTTPDIAVPVFYRLMRNATDENEMAPVTEKLSVLFECFREEEFVGDEKTAAWNWSLQSEALFSYIAASGMSIPQYKKSLTRLQATYEGKEDPLNFGEHASKLERYMADLDDMIGLDDVKLDVKKLIALIRFRKKRAEAGIEGPGHAQHLCFTGNPGTGKTTVARILGRVYKELGILEKGHFVEAGRADLVAEYVGQTAPKTKKKIEEALGGILFIDEAYALYGEGKDFGREAISTLIAEMENRRGELIVILAGYPKEMEQMMDMNPGLKSRVNKYIHFADYSPNELVEIFDVMAGKEYHFTYGEDVQAEILKIVTEEKQKSARTFGNGRLVRNIIEKLEQELALRLSEEGKLDEGHELTEADMKALTVEDVRRVNLDQIRINETARSQVIGINPRPEPDAQAVPAVRPIRKPAVPQPQFPQPT